MNQSNQIPAIYHKCHEKFGVKWSQGIIITYGDTVYCKQKLTPDKIAHEGVHVKQQTAMDKDLWWDKYLEDEEFRLFQEVEAYKTEANWVRKNVKDNNLQVRLLHQICLDLSSSIYGNICTYSQAKQLTK